MIQKIIIKIIIYSLIITLLIFGIYYFFIENETDNESLDPLACQFDDDCTYYSPLNNCYRAEPINIKYKTNILKITESENTLCGQIKTACINYQCAIKR